MSDRAYIVSRTLETKIAMAENNGNNALIVTLDVLKEILVLLKEQEAVKPKYTPKSIYSWECGVCGEPFDRIAKYCPECGRKVKWE